MDSEHFDGFIMRDGEFIPIDDAERMYKAAEAYLKAPQDIMGMMWELAWERAALPAHPAAQAYDGFGESLALTEGETLPECCGIGEPQNGY